LLSPQHLANLAWSFAKLLEKDTKLLASISATALEMIGEARGHHHLDGKSGVCVGAHNLFRAFNPQDLANTAWSLSRLVVLNTTLREAIAASARAQITAFRPQHLQNTAWAFASLEVPNAPLLSAIAAAALRHITAYDAQGIANLAWSWSRLAVSNAPLMHSIAAAAIAIIQSP